MGDTGRTGAHAQRTAARAATPARYRAPDRSRARGTAQAPCDPVVQRRSSRRHRCAAAAHAGHRGIFPAAGATGRRLGMMEEITRLSAALAERMRELRADPTDPRLAPLVAQYQALVRQHMATVKPAIATSVPATEYAFDLPPELDA